MLSEEKGMNFDKFTLKSQETIRNSQQLAEKRWKLILSLRLPGPAKERRSKQFWQSEPVIE